MPNLIDIVIPATGESVTSGVVAKWTKPDGSAVKRDETVLELETDKITVEVPAPAAGRLKHAVKVGDTVAVGGVVGQVEEGAAGEAASGPAPTKAPEAAKPAAAKAAAPVPTPVAAPANGHAEGRATPLAKKMADEHGLDLGAIPATGPGGRVREQDVLAAIQAKQSGPAVATASRPAAAVATPTGGVRRERMSPLRARIAQRLVEAQSNAAMLTTFNEVDMSNVMALRARYKDEFEKRHGVGLGFMSFFVKAATLALQKMPVVNAHIVQNSAGDLEVEYHEACHVSVAVSTPKGLTVPVLRNCERLSFAGIESAIRDLATRARDGKLTLEDLQGGTFTVTNGGIFGSLMSTPILNAPQTAILGMHAIKNRPVENPDKPGEIVLRPMMYLAMSYDHRLLDGQEAVTFLVSIKNAIERPERMLMAL